MTQQSNQSSSTSCLKDKLADSEKKANEAEFHKQTAATLQELIAKSEAEINKYRDALPGLIDEWKKQDAALKEMKRHLETCYPDWECILKHAVCSEVICKKWNLRKSYESRMGESELRLQYTDADLSEAKNHLEAWKTITSWVTKKLDDNKKLYERICALDTCTSPLLQLYLFFFVLWPQHRLLCRNANNSYENDSYPEHAYCSSTCDAPKKSCTCLIGYPRIIPWDSYDCQLTRVWQAWSDAGIRKAKAQSAFEQIAKDQEEYQTMSTPEAMEKAAGEALARFDRLEKENIPCPEKEDPCEPTPDDNEDPCMIDPCKLEEEQKDDCKPGEDEGPCDQPEPECPDPCKEPEPKPEPREEPEPDPCQEPEPEPEPEDPEPCDDPDEPEGKNSGYEQDDEQKQAAPPKGKSAS